MADTGVEYIRYVDADIKKIKEEVSGLCEVTNRLRADILLESKLRGGDIGSLQHKASSDLAAEISKLRKESEDRFTILESQTKSWTASLGQEIMNLKPRISSLEEGLLLRGQEIETTTERCGLAEQDIQTVRGELSATATNFAAQITIVTTQVGTDREVASAANRATATKAMQDFQRAEEKNATLTHSLDCMRKAVLADISAVSAKLEAIEAFAYTRAKAADVQALELRVTDTIDKSLRAVNEELGRKEYSSNVKSLSDRLVTLSLDVNANDAKSKAGDEVLAKQIAACEHSVSKISRQLDLDRERANECWVSLERECGTKAAKNDLDATTVRLSVVESTVQPMVHTVAAKADTHDMKHLGSRVLALEQVYPLKADASELPKLHLMLADCTAKHSGVMTRAQEQHNRIERFDDAIRETQAKLESVDGKTKEFKGVLSMKADADTVFNKEASAILLKDFYKREEIDAMMTRVWWRVSDAAKTSSRITSPWTTGP
mmetsp:Transcript_54976/g.158139  ORF Transcript_54976/g.158139 Transcript_54976/m.158139 type:complete len:493 (+) Transcript_54976:103-1581(+)